MKRAGISCVVDESFTGSLEGQKRRNGADGYRSSFIMVVLRTSAADQSLGDLTRKCSAGVSGSTSNLCFEVVYGPRPLLLGRHYGQWMTRAAAVS